MNSLNSESGQMLLIVVLVMVVALTVGLSVATRSITNVKISKQNEESQRAFQAAEAGLELNIRKALDGGLQIGSDTQFDNNSSFTVANPTPIQISSTVGDYLNSGDPVTQDRGIDVWLMEYDNYKKAGPTESFGPSNAGSKTVELSWQKNGVTQTCSSGDTRTSALEVWVLKGTNKTTQLQVEKYYYDPCATATGYNTLPTDTTGENTATDDFKYRSTLTVANGIALKVIPIYNPTKIYVEGNNLPSQGKIVTSEGKSGETVRKLEYTQFYPEFPTEMFYALLTQ
jgi:type II secretory pathway pseudopilin PulG